MAGKSSPFFITSNFINFKDHSKEIENANEHIAVEIIDGKAEIVISGISHVLQTGEYIVIPEHSPNFVEPNGRFRMIQSIIKSGYEQ